MSTPTVDLDADTAPSGELVVVGIGASAGGIRACREFFAATPADSGMAYVVILHLSPDHESHLAEVLQHESRMPVTQVTDPAPIEPNHVYVIPPNKSLAMVDETLVLSEIGRIEERRSPVDVFLRTLAQSRRSNAVCVILSGTGPNGSNGLRQIKERGGVVLAQDPEQAEYDDMPRHAIATGLVDLVLPVAEMPRRILAWRDGRGRVTSPEAPPPRGDGDREALRDILMELRRDTGHDFSSYKEAAILRRIERRLALHQTTTLAEYVRIIREHADEPKALLRDLLISVTHFFRDAEAFEKLDTGVIASLVERRDDEHPVRVWVPGCATGEEAYSLAMLFAERSGGVVDPAAVQVFASDVDERSIAVAREGLYTEAEVADVSPERLRRFFRKETDGYRVARDLRETVLFAHHNVIRDPPFSHLDLVSCRNFLIYLNRAAQQRVMEVLHFALKPGGYLFLGGSETVDGASAMFLTVDKDAHIYQCRGVGVRPTLPLSDLGAPRRLERLRRVESGLPEIRIHDRAALGELHHRLLEQYGPPSLVVNEEHHLVHLSERAGRYLQLSGGEMSTSILRLVRPELRMELRTALHQAGQRRTAVEARGIATAMPDRTELVNLLVRPVLGEDDPARGYFLVVFEDASPPAGAGTPADGEVVRPVEPAARHLEDEVVQLRAQLRATVEQYETQAEEGKAAHEELQAINEELRSTAEELETSREELQSVNEELTTVNQELKNKIDELSQASNDVRNLINSTDIGTIFLDRALCVKLFTPRARDGFNLIPADIGRPLSDITSQILYGDLMRDAERVLATLQVFEREVSTRSGRSYLLRLLPYRTGDDRIEGLVLTLIEITERLRAEVRMRAGEERMRLLIERAEDYAIVTLSPDHLIDSWNVGAERMFGYAEEEILGQSAGILFTAEDRAAGVPEDDWRRAREQGRAEAERWQLRKDGERIFASGVIHALRDAELLGFAWIARDLTGRQQSEAELRRAYDELEARVRDRTLDLEEDVRRQRASEKRTRLLLRHIVTAQEDERRRVARDLHDQLGQRVTALRLGLDRLAQGSTAADFDRQLTAIRETAGQLDGEVSFLAWELRPAALDDLGLVAALEQYVVEWSRHYGIEAAFHADALRLDADLEVSLYRIAQEALNNVVKHAQASRVEVLIEARPGEVVLIVEDNGVGFSPEEVTGRGLGLLGVSERASLVGGSLEIESNSGAGATVFVRIPLGGEGQA
jgi:two-component system CheB/CheR fusion protein